MATIQGLGASGEVSVLFSRGSFVGLSDGSLLEQFATQPDEAGELAFATLVDRHGPMVYRVCSGLLKDWNDAEDAFQATFLVLARKARSLWVRETIGPWLHGVACRIAARLLSDRARRNRHEQRAADTRPATVGPDEPDDFAPVLHEEIERLPERFRAAIVLCYLEGLTHEQAADRLGWPVGTVRSRLARGRDRLRRRLDLRGVAPSIALPDGGSVAQLAAAIRPSLAVATVRAASRSAAANMAAGAGPAVVSLTTGILRTMMLNSLLKVAAGVLATGLIATGAAALAFQGNELAEASPAARSQATATTRPAKSEAETIAEGFLKTGADLFNDKDSEGLAATYTEDGEILIVSRKDGQIQDEVRRGRSAVKDYYASLFRNAGEFDSRNFVESARLIAPDVLVVHGNFRINPGEAELPFVQLRVKQGDRWLMSKLWLFLLPPGH